MLVTVFERLKVSEACGTIYSSVIKNNILAAYVVFSGMMDCIRFHSHFDPKVVDVCGIVPRARLPASKLRNY